MIRRHHGNRALGLVLLGFVLGAAAAIALMMNVQAPAVRTPATSAALFAPVVPGTTAGPGFSAALAPGPVVPAAKSAAPPSIARSETSTPAAKGRAQAPTSAQTQEDAAAAGMTSRRPKATTVEADQLF